jgi:hypothetical protein
MTGWMKHRLPASVLLLCSAYGVPAAEPPTPTVAAAATPAPETTSTPGADDEEFLVFLGGWEDSQGNWQDPLEYEDPAWAQLDDPQEKGK